MKQLSATDEDEATQLFPATSPTTAPKGKGEVSVNTRHNWKKALGRFAGSNKNTTGEEPPYYVHIIFSDLLLESTSDPEREGWWNDPSDLCHILNRSRADIERLWNDPNVQAELKRKRLRLQESSGLCAHAPFHSIFIN